MIGVIGIAVTLIVGLLCIGVSILLWLNPRSRALLARAPGHLVHHMVALGGELRARGTVSAKLIRKDGTTVDLGELKPPK